MPVIISLDVSVIPYLLIITACALLLHKAHKSHLVPVVKSLRRGSRFQMPYKQKIGVSFVAEDHPLDPTESEGGQEDPRNEQMKIHKVLYFKLQNLEQHPEVLPQSRDLLISFLSEALEQACKTAESEILNIKHFTRDGLTEFLDGQNEKVMQEWVKYLGGREQDWRMRMFDGQKEAKWWLRQVAPVKYVDGAWLGTSFVLFLRRVSIISKYRNPRANVLTSSSF